MSAIGASSDLSTSVRLEFVLPRDQVNHLWNLAETRQISECRVVEKALDVFLSLAEVFDPDLDRQAWYRLSEPSLLRVWDNAPDAAYDNWRELYDISQW